MAAKGNVNDRRVQRSRALLYDTLVELMESVDFKDITVKDLTDKANIARPTFYRNYDAVEDILVLEMDAKFEGFFESIQVDLAEKDFAGFADKLLMTWADNNKLFTAMQKAGVTHQILRRFEEYSIRIKKAFFPQATMTAQSQFATYFFAGGCYMVLLKWLEDDMQASKEGLVDLIKDCFYNLLSK